MLCQFKYKAHHKLQALTQTAEKLERFLLPKRAQRIKIKAIISLPPMAVRTIACGIGSPFTILGAQWPCYELNQGQKEVEKGLHSLNNNRNKYISVKQILKGKNHFKDVKKRHKKHRRVKTICQISLLIYLQVEKLYLNHPERKVIFILNKTFTASCNIENNIMNSINEVC